MEVQDQRLACIEQFLSNLVGTQKRIQLYPANSPVIREAMSRLAAGLDSLFEASDGPITLGIVRDQFYDGQRAVAPGNIPIMRFAATLYQSQVKVLGISPGVTGTELRRFLALVCLKPEEIQAGGGMAAQMAALRLEHVSVEEAVELQLIKRDKTADEWDILDYIKNRSRAARRESGEDAGGAEMGDGGGGVTAEELADFFFTTTDGSLEKARCFRNTLGDPARLAEVFNVLAAAQAARKDGVGGDADHSLDGAFRQIAATIAALPEPGRDECARSVAEAILETRPPVRRYFMRQVLPSQLGQFRSVDLIISALRDEAVGSILTDHVMFHEGSLRTLGNFLADLSDDPGRTAQLQETLSRTLATSDQGRIRQLAESLEDRKPVRTSDYGGGGPAAARSRRDAAGAREEAPNFTAVPPRTVERLSAALSEDCTANAYPYAAGLVLSLQGRDGCGDFADGAVHLVARSLQVSFEQQRYDQMVRVLDLAQSHEDAAPELRDRSLAAYLDEGRLDGLVDAMRGHDRATGEYGHLVTLLKLAGDRAVLRLFQRLSDEADRIRRIFLLQVLVDLGDAVTGAMGRNISDPKWFVVRNAVFVLGKVASETAVDMLVQVQGHAEARVRLEVVRALGAIGGEKAENAVLALLADEDASVAEQAADCLSRFEPARALPRLRALLTEERKSLHGRPHVASGVAAYFAEHGERDDLRLLAGFRPSRLRCFSQRHRAIAGACRRSIRRIRERSAGGAS